MPLTKGTKLMANKHNKKQEKPDEVEKENPESAEETNDVESSGSEESGSELGSDASEPTGDAESEEASASEVDPESESAPLTTPEIPPVNAKELDALKKLAKLGEFFSSQKEDDIVKSYKVIPVNVHLILDLSSRIKKPGFRMSDGNIERVETLYSQLKKYLN